MNKNIKILVVDDEEHILFAFQEVFKKEGYTCVEARSGREALHKLNTEQPDLVFMDITMPDMDGLRALKQIKDQDVSVPVILITGHGTMHTAIKAMQLGAFEYLTKPLSISKVREVTQRVLASISSSVTEKTHYKSDIADHHELIGNSDAIQEIYKLIGTISTTPNHTSVLVLGESGTGKELVARAIHSYSAGSVKPFIAINCTAFPETLLESEIFGHEKGTFTGATERKIGKFEVAEDGTIFLDEIADLPENLQIKLLRVLQEREFERLGGHTPIQIKARFIAATNQNIMEKVETGKFREDLYFRLNKISIQLPPLRERSDDIPLLANYFLEKYNYKLKKSIKGISDEAMLCLKSYSYPGNIRELENLIERAVMLTKTSVILPDVLSEMDAAKISKSPYFPIVSSIFSEAREYVLNLFEKQFIIELLNKHEGNVSAAARESNMTRQNFHRLIMKHNIRTHNI